MVVRLVALLALALAPVALSRTAQAQTPAACVRAFEACAQACLRNNPDSPAGRQGCQARCEAERAACDAQAAVEAAKPWVKRKVDEMWRFLEGFLNGPDGQGPMPAPPAPTPRAPERDHESDDRHDQTDT